MATTQVNSGQTVQYSNGANYNINGGTVEIDAPTNSTNQTYTASASVTNAIGEVYVTVPNTAGKADSYTLNITNQLPKGFKLVFKNTRTQSPTIDRTITESYNASKNQTTVSIAFSQSDSNSSGIFINIPGNPYNLTPGQSTQTKLPQGQTYTETAVCYLAGTMIATPEGRAAVETLKIGDLVNVLVDGDVQARPLVWTGSRTVTARHADDYAIRIRQNAIAPNVPDADLYVTPEHCLYLEGRFVPARMLVNGASIVIDKTQTTFDVYHIETEQHAILDANGVFAESYLDTGNRHTFRDGSTVVLLPGAQDARSWADNAAAPLDVSRGFVEPIHAALSARAAEFGYAAAREQRVLTNDADLRLRTQDGQVLRAVAHSGDEYRFAIPAGVAGVSILSNSSRPSDVIGPFVDDRRELGVLVGDASLVEQGVATSLNDAFLTDLAGWSFVEGATCRWTAGEAELPFTQAVGGEGAELVLKIRAAGPYVLYAASAFSKAA